MRIMLKKITLALMIIVNSAMVVAADTITFARTGVAGLEELHMNDESFKNKLEEFTEKMKSFPVNGRNAVVEVLDSGVLDFAMVGPAEYLVFRERALVQPVVDWQRMNYSSQIITPIESNINNIHDLKGKKIAFGNVGSTSMYLESVQLLAGYNLKIGKYHNEINIHRNVSTQAMLHGDIAISSAYLGNIRKFFPEDGFKVIERGPYLPNYQVVAGHHV